MRTAPPAGPSPTSAALRWTLAGAVVLAAHAGAGWWIVTHPLAAVNPPDAVQGVTIDLEPIAVPQSGPPASATAAPGPAPTPQAVAAPDPQPTPPPPDATPPAPAPPPPPDPAPAAPSDAVLAQPQPPPRPPQSRPVPKPLPPRPDPRAVAREAAAQRALAERREAERAARAARRVQAAQERADEAQGGGGRSDQAAAAGSASSGAAVATWRGAVVAHLNASRPASPNGANGTARVAFTVDRGGRVVSVSLSGSSGDAALDEAAVAMVRRASPVPAPPPELGGRVSLAVPVRFH